MLAREPGAEREKLQRWTFLILLVAIGYLFWLVAQPLWVPLFLGTLLAIGMHPLHKALVHKLHGKRREAISALALTSGALTIGLSFTGLLSVIVLRQLLAMIRTFAARAKIETATQLIGPKLSDLLASFGENPERLQKKLIEATAAIAGNLGEDATRILSASFGAALVLIFSALTTYYLLRHGEKFTGWFVTILPLPDVEVWELVRNFRDVARVMLLGTGATSLYQGAMSTLAYWVAGVPHPLVWGVATGFASILPAIGTTIVWLPLVGFLIVTDHLAMGIGLLLWSGFMIIGVADYVLRPRLLGNKVRMNDLVIFIALFGGIEAFGLLGTILGPIIAALFVSMLRIYQRDYRPRPARVAAHLLAHRANPGQR